MVEWVICKSNEGDHNIIDVNQNLTWKLMGERELAGNFLG